MLTAITPHRPMLPARLPASETPVHAAVVPQRQISAQSAAIIEVLAHAEIPCSQGDKAFMQEIVLGLSNTELVDLIRSFGVNLGVICLITHI